MNISWVQSPRVDPNKTNIYRLLFSFFSLSFVVCPLSAFPSPHFIDQFHPLSLILLLIRTSLLSSFLPSFPTHYFTIITTSSSPPHNNTTTKMSISEKQTTIQMNDDKGHHHYDDHLDHEELDIHDEHHEEEL